MSCSSMVEIGSSTVFSSNNKNSAYYKLYRAGNLRIKQAVLTESGTSKDISKYRGVGEGE